MKPASVILVIGICFCLEGTAPCWAQCELEQAFESASGTSGRFGAVVTLNDEFAMIAAPYENCDMGPYCGAVYVFREKEGRWIPWQALATGSRVPGGHFGWALALSGQVAVVGAPEELCSTGEGSGAAYIFRLEGDHWVPENRLEACNTGEWGFGRSVAADGDWVMVGTPRAVCPDGPNCGAAYVYRFQDNRWKEVQELTASDQEPFDSFGSCVALADGMAIIAANFDKCPGGDWGCGAAYSFRMVGNEWKETQKLLPPEVTPHSRFGWSISMKYGLAVISAPFGMEGPAQNVGAAHVFRFEGSHWNYEDELVASDARQGDLFGYSVWTNEARIVVGSISSQSDGTVFVFENDGSAWWQSKSIALLGLNFLDSFGASIAGTGEHTLIGAPGVDDCYPNHDCGGAYLFDVASDCQEGTLDIEPGECPNEVKMKGGGVIEVAVAGNVAFDVRQIDVDSLELRRVDGVGVSIGTKSAKHGSAGNSGEMPKNQGLETRYSGMQGTIGSKTGHDEPPRGTQFRDVATFWIEAGCFCRGYRADGFDDVILKFDAKELIEAFELEGEEIGTSLDVLIAGVMMDGTVVRARDCIVVGR